MHFKLKASKQTKEQAKGENAGNSEGARNIVKAKVVMKQRRLERS